MTYEDKLAEMRCRAAKEEKRWKKLQRQGLLSRNQVQRLMRCAARLDEIIARKWQTEE